MAWPPRTSASRRSSTRVRGPHHQRVLQQWRDLPGRFGPWRTVCERHRLRSADGARERLLQQVQAAVGA
ncbi:hypothetical protein D3105_31960 [Streptomyces globisporus]|uniref:Transposase n=1 Tax=Streptomyces globisporus TaxID=1908 RepID=A0A423UQI9_STRGL|nr:hypothetical protein D3105_31960 [Streptomyces globisporus]